MTPIQYRAGDVILDDLPYAVAVNIDYAKSACSFCFNSGTPAECAGCNKIVYCDEQCQENDSVDHRVECEVLAGCEEMPDEEQRLVIRTLAKFLRERDQPTVGDYFGRPRTINNLLSHVEDLNKSERAEVTARADEILELLDGRLDVDQDLVVEMIMKCRINRYCLTYHNEPNFFVRGQVVYLAASSIDHTCVINEQYTYLFDGRRIILRALTDFTLDDPNSLRIHYLSSIMPYEQRRSTTLDTYFFLCSCDKCVREARAPELEPEQKQKAEEAAAEIDALYEGSRTTEEWYKEGSQILAKYEKVLQNDSVLLWLVGQLQLSAVELELLEESLRLGARTLQQSETVLSMEPVLYNMCYAMSRLGWNSKDNKNHKAFLKGQRLTKSLFKISHGRDHQIVKWLESFEQPGAANEVQQA